jgi:4-hydroxybenzoyl-CoA reductase subunit beta
MTGLLSDFRIVRPASVQDAISHRVSDSGARFLAGGTDVVVAMRHGLSRPGLLVDLSGIDELGHVRREPQGTSIGAGVTVGALTRDAAIRALYPAVADAAAVIAGPGHRVMATVGGNLCLDTRCIYYNQSEWWRHANGYCLKYRGDTCHVAPKGQRCHAAYTGDLAAALLALDAHVEVASGAGRRRIPLQDLYIEDGARHLALAEDELVVAVHLPPDPPPSVYQKLRVRQAIDYPLAGVAVALDAGNATIRAIRIALTGTNSRPFILRGTHDLSGRAIDQTLLRDVDRLVQKQVQPMRTTTVSANYRRVAAAALARRLITWLSAQGETPGGPA